MTIDRPPVKLRQPGVVVVHYEWPDHLAPEAQAELLEVSRAAALAGPVALVFVLADRLRAIPPSVRGFWRSACSDQSLRVTAMAVVTSSWGVEVGAAGFGVTSALSGAPLPVQTFRAEAEAVEWASGWVGGGVADGARPAVAGGRRRESR